ncbi:hypothetical protein ACH5RR_028267 [Cinchona calisaya]|uniref:Tyrosinase copper-binding domain-containing protein n=1 Tax=Cinchona calisaya TaxID=153742 RepID=A0ABD2YN85_9GENT
MVSLTMPILSTNFANSYSSSNLMHFTSPSKPTFPNCRRGTKVTCNATNGDPKITSDNTEVSKKIDGETSLVKLDGRNVVLGIGGLYGATSFGTNPSAYAAPLAPTFTACHDSTDPDKKPIDCCPPTAAAADSKDYVPTAPKVVNTRLAAHLVDDTWLAKYKKALTAMRKLDDSDPRSFKAQANVHCAYCNGGYYQAGYETSKLNLDVHFSWLFFPFHIWYLYFFERIFQKYADDDTFTIPFWNWANPYGMFFPSIFIDSSSPLHDSLRNSNHLTKVLDLNYKGTDTSDSTITVIKNNLITMYKQMVTQSTTATAFFGKPFRAGNASGPGAGSIETTPHTNVHRWVGSEPGEADHGEDMGTFYSAGRDPVFYSHHANVDRMWNLWDSLGGQNFNDSDWLNSSFYF